MTKTEKQEAEAAVKKLQTIFAIEAFGWIDRAAVYTTLEAAQAEIERRNAEASAALNADRKVIPIPVANCCTATPRNGV